jgi:DNA ligase-1
MRRFAQLYADLDDTRATSQKLAAMRRYFEAAPPEDAAWGLYFLLGNRLKRVIPPSRLRAWIAQATGLPDAVIEESYSHVGDLGETVALLFDREPRVPTEASDVPLHRCVESLLALQDADEIVQRDLVLERWRTLPFLECLLFNKLLTGSLRVGVSGGLAARSEERRVGKECRRLCRSRWSPYH